MLAQSATVDRLLEPFAPLPDLLVDVLSFSVVSVSVYLVGLLLVVPAAVRVVRARNRNNPTVVTATETYIRVLLVTVSLLAGLAAAGQLSHLFDTNSAILVAALTFLFGVAGQEVLGSLVSGFFLVADPDFNVGDWIAWPGGEGFIEAVDFRVTRIRTPDNETVTVPNTELTTNTLTRPFARDRVRVVERAFLSYDDDTERALLELQQVASALEGAIADPSPRTRVEELGPSSVVVETLFWVESTDRSTVADVRSDFRRQVKRRFDELGLTLAPPSDQALSGSVTVTGADDVAAVDD